MDSSAAANDGGPDVIKYKRNSVQTSPAGAVNKSWLEYLVKSRDGIERLSSNDADQQQTAEEYEDKDDLNVEPSDMTIASNGQDAKLKKRSSMINYSASRRTTSASVGIPSIIAQPKRFTSQVDSEAYARSLLEVIDPQIISKPALETQGDAKSSVVLIKIFEVPGDQILDSKLPEYKMLTVGRDSTVLEMLTLILRKWRYFDPKTYVEVVKNRPVMTETIKSFLELEGWELLAFGKSPSGDLDVSNCVLANSKTLQDVIGDFGGTENMPYFGFRRREETAALGDFQQSQLFEACYCLKLESSFPTTQLQNQTDIDINHWSKRYIMLARNRYLLFFKSKNHARWVQYVQHEIDFSRVSAVQKGNVVVTDDTHLITMPDDNTPIAKFSIKIFTRSRVIVLAVSTEQERERIIKQMNEIIMSVSLRKEKIRSSAIDGLIQGERAQRTSSAHSFETTISPMTRLMSKVEKTRHLNDIDLPPFEYDPLTTEWLSWTVSTNHSLFLTVKQLAFSKLNSIITEHELSEFAELLGFSRDGNNDGTLKASDRDDKSGMVTQVKKFWRGISNQPSSSTLGLNESSKAPQFYVFGVPLDDLAARYDLSGLGIPVIPPFVRLTVSHLKQHGLHVGGLFRIAGSFKRMEALKKAWEKMVSTQFKSGTSSLTNEATSSASSFPAIEFHDGDIDLSPYNVHDVAGVLKLFFRDLPDPVISSKLYRAFLSTEKLKQYPDKQLKMLQLLVMLLPPINRHLLEYLLEFMHAIAEWSEDRVGPDGVTVKGNLMNSSNLAVVMGPNILREATVKQAEEQQPPPPSKSLSPTGVGAHLQRSMTLARRVSNDGMNTLSGGSGSAMNVASIGEEDRKTVTASQELSDSSAVGGIVKLMIDHYKEIFTISAEFLDELKRLSSSGAVHISRS